MIRAFLFLLPMFIIQAVSAAEAKSNLSHFTISTEAPNNKDLEFLYRAPHVDQLNQYPAGIMVLFGGRNWPAAKTIPTYDFNTLADKFNLYLISPSFRDDDYWEPEKWSGKALLNAIEVLKKKHHLSNPNLYFYGYSAGGQCANLFYFWAAAPQALLRKTTGTLKSNEACKSIRDSDNNKKILVQAVAWHACGVYPSRARYPQKKDLQAKVPMLITCGEADDIRFQLSYSLAQELRENGGSIIFKNYLSGHGLNAEALELARSFFDDILSGKATTEYIAEDFIDTIIKTNNPQVKMVDKEFRNPFFSKKTAELWLEPSNKKEAR